MKIPSGLSRFAQQSYSYVKDPQKLLRLLKTVVAYAKKNRSKIRGLNKELKLLVELIKAWATGQYKRVPTQTLVLIVAALLYFLWPLDLLPDPIFIDDAAVLAFVIQSIASDMGKFKAWKRGSKKSIKSPGPRPRATRKPRKKKTTRRRK